jgi:hypothetical protein
MLGDWPDRTSYGGAHDGANVPRVTLPAEAAGDASRPRRWVRECTHVASRARLCPRVYASSATRAVGTMSHRARGTLHPHVRCTMSHCARGAIPHKYHFPFSPQRNDVSPGPDAPTPRPRRCARSRRAPRADRARARRVGGALARVLSLAPLLPLTPLAQAQETAERAAAPGAARRNSNQGKKQATAKPKAKSTTKRAAKGDTAKGDTARRASVGALGRNAGDRHLAYRETGATSTRYGRPRCRRRSPGRFSPPSVSSPSTATAVASHGILGEFDPPEMLRRLDAEVAEWNRLDPQHPVQPALHLIAVVAQAGAGSDGKYRARMDSVMVERVYAWAKSRNAILFLDVQVGLSTLQAELPLLERYLKRPRRAPRHRSGVLDEERRSSGQAHRDL